MFTTGSNAFATGREQLRMSHARVGRRQADPRHDRASATNAGTRSASDFTIDGGRIGHSQGHGAHHRPGRFG